MRKDPLIYIRHMDSCLERIIQYTAGLDEAAFLRDTLVQDAVLRNFEILGEAAKNVDDAFRQQYPEIEWRKISGMRDKLIHDYIGVDLWAVWGVVEKVLPRLKADIRGILLNEGN